MWSQPRELDKVGQKLIYLNDIIFICEHWLAKEQEFIVHDILKENQHQILFESGFSLAEKEFFNKKRGRPFGGTLWAIRHEINVKEYVILSNQISKITIQLNTIEELVIYGVWLGFDDSNNRAKSNQEFPNNLDFLQSEITYLNCAETSYIILGDFNADLNRRFDKHLKKFLACLNRACHLNKVFTEVKQKIKNIYLQRKILGYRQLHEETVLRKMKKYLRNIQKMVLQVMNSEQI